MEIRKAYVIKGSRFPDLIKRAFRGCRGQFYVYSWFRGAFCLYVGYSGNLAQRFCSHTVLNKYDEVRPTDVIFLDPCNDISHAKELEREMITWLEPIFNTSMKPFARSLTVKRLAEAQEHLRKLNEVTKAFYQHSLVAA